MHRVEQCVPNSSEEEIIMVATAKSSAEESWDLFHGEMQNIIPDLMPGEAAVEGLTEEKLAHGHRTKMKMGDVNFLGLKEDAPTRILCTHTTYHIHTDPRSVYPVRISYLP